jgi:hypothetical protein
MYRLVHATAPDKALTWLFFISSSVLVITLWKVLQYYLSHGRSHLLDIFLKYAFLAIYIVRL